MSIFYKYLFFLILINFILTNIPARTQSIDSLIQIGYQLFIDECKILEARNCLERVVILDPDQSLPYYYLGNICEYSGDLNWAIYYYDKFARLDSTSTFYISAVKNSLFLKMLQNGVFADSINSIWQYKNIIRTIECLINTENLHEALINCQRARYLVPTNPTTYLIESSLFAMISRYDLAIKVLDTALYNCNPDTVLINKYRNQFIMQNRIRQYTVSYLSLMDNKKFNLAEQEAINAHNLCVQTLEPILEISNKDQNLISQNNKIIALFFAFNHQLKILKQQTNTMIEVARCAKEPNAYCISQIKDSPDRASEEIEKFNKLLIDLYLEK